MLSTVREPPMTRTTSATSARRRAARRSLGALVALAVVTTAAAPGVITIKPGDTLWDLARTHGTSVSTLRALNDLPGNGTIYAGRTLRLSDGSSGSAGGSGGSSGEGSHLVRRGETLSHIALRHGVSQRSIATRNRLSGGRVYAGQRLAVPGAGGSTAGVPSPNAGVRVPQGVRTSVAENRRILASRDLPSKTQVRRMIATTARQYDVPVSLAVAVAYHESGFQQRVVSGVNAIGVMQVLPRTGRVLGQQHGRSLDLLDTQDNITAGVLLLRQLLRSTPSTDRALAGYYQGAGSIAKKGLLPQTHDYIRSITILRKRFANG